jgi:hypothetical protein
LVKDWVSRRENGKNQVVVCDWAALPPSDPNKAASSDPTVVRMFKAVGASEGINVSYLPAFEEIVGPLRDDQKDRLEELVDQVRCELTVCSAVFIAGGDQARISHLLKVVPGLRDVFVDRLQEGDCLFLGSSAGAAVMGDPVVLGHSSRGADGSSLSQEEFAGLLVGKTYIHSKVARTGCGFLAIPQIPYVDQHHGLDGGVVAKFRNDPSTRIFADDGTTPVIEIRAKDKRTDRFRELTFEEPGLAVWEDCGCAVFKKGDKTYVMVFADNVESPLRAPGSRLPAAGFFIGGEVQHLYPGCLYRLAEDGKSLEELGGWEDSEDELRAQR